MNAIKIFVLLSFLKICEFSAVYQSKTDETTSLISSQVFSEIIGGEEGDVKVEINEIADETQSLAESTTENEINSSTLDFLGIVFDITVTGFRELFRTGPFDDSIPVKIGTRSISGYEAVLFVPDLLEYLPKLSNAAKTIESNENIIYAVKMRSLVPDYIFDIVSVPERRHICPHDLTILSAHQRIIDSINDIMNRFSVQKNHAAIDQIVNFDLNGEKSVNEFVAEKEAEIALKMAESLENIHQIRNLLNIDSQFSDQFFKTHSLNLLIAVLSKINFEYEKMQENQLKLLSVDPSNNAEVSITVTLLRQNIISHFQDLVSVLEQDKEMIYFDRL